MRRLQINAENLTAYVHEAFNAVSGEGCNFTTPTVTTVQFHQDIQDRFLNLPVLRTDKRKASNKIGKGYLIMLLYGHSDGTFFYRFCLLQQAIRPTDPPEHMILITYLYTPKHGTERWINISVDGQFPSIVIRNTARIFKIFFDLLSEHIEK